MERKQAKFCLEFLRTGNATEAYKAAGYTPRSDAIAAVCASQLLRKPNVQKHLDELRKEMDVEIIADAFERRVKLTAILRDKENSVSDITKAIDILNKMDGLYIQKNELRGANGEPVVFNVHWHGNDETEAEV